MWIFSGNVGNLERKKSKNCKQRFFFSSSRKKKRLYLLRGGCFSSHLFCSPCCSRSLLLNSRVSDPGSHSRHPSPVPLQCVLRFLSREDFSNISPRRLLRGTTVNRTYGTRKKTTCLHVFTMNNDILVLFTTAPRKSEWGRGYTR